MTFDLIPTPQRVEPRGRGRHSLNPDRNLKVAVDAGDTGQGRFVARFIRDQLAARTGLKVTRAPHANLRFNLGDDPALHHDLAAEQGYVIRCRADEPVRCIASTPIGLLYAAATFVQLLDADATLPRVDIVDWPAFRTRGIDWLIKAELTGWSHARGDDARTIEARMLAQLDVATLYKINFIYFDGFNWNPSRFPGYAPMMRRLNKAARLRGIRLCFGGHGAYAESPEMINRKRYPDGDSYPCIGYLDKAESRHRGTCLSNRKLTTMRAARLAQFVKATHPGAIYYHNLDTGAIAESDAVWNLRCDACRKRWPNDDVTAPDGMAGAFAAFYTAVAKAVPDTPVIVVSPGYTADFESDADWRRNCEYWVNVSRNMPTDNVILGLREQFAAHGSKKLRYPELRKRLDRDARGHAFVNLNFFGGDTFFNSHPYITNPTLNHYFQGADGIVCGNGHGYQQPQALLNAECAWNPTGSADFKPPPIETFKDCRKRYLRLSRAEDKPGRFLDRACDRLYGNEGPRVAKVLRLRGKTNLGSPQFTRFSRATVWLPVYNYLLPTERSFRHSGVVWQHDIDTKQIRRLAAVYREVEPLNAEACRLLKPCAHEDVVAMRDAMAAARRYAVMLADFLDLFLEAHRAMRRKNRDAAIASVARYRRRLAPFHHAMTQGLPETPLPTDIEANARMIAADQIRNRLDPIAHSLRTGHFSDQSQ